MMINSLIIGSWLLAIIVGGAILRYEEIKEERKERKERWL